MKKIICLTFISAFLLSACGQSGRLYLPKEQVKKQSNLKQEKSIKQGSSKNETHH